MIEEINIENLGVISNARLSLGKGFTAVTGETGAGKTMVVSALSMIIGARAKSGVVRSNAEKAEVEASVVIPSDSKLAEIAEEHNLLLDDVTLGLKELILNRSITQEGRSKALAGGRKVPLAVLNELTEQLIEIHGQSDQMRLRSISAQRDALDRFLGKEHRELLKTYKAKYQLMLDTQKRLAALNDVQDSEAEELEELTEELEFYDEVEPKENEDEELKAESIRLSNLEELRHGAYRASQALVSDNFGEVHDASAMVGEARSSIDSLEDPELEEILERLETLNSEISEAANDLTSYVENLDTDGPARLNQVEQRRAKINELLRDHGSNLEDVFQWEREARVRFDELSNGGQSLAELEEEVAELENVVTELAREITEARKQAATQLSKAVTEELHGLLMADATFHVQVTSEELSNTGADNVEFLLQPHAGSRSTPVNKGASGGELSRVMLAIEVVFAGNGSNAPTFVFDEVDAGVGGKAAIQIGQRLAKLAKYKQVICVTHLPQVAAFANNHISVVKTSNADAGVTHSDIRTLVGQERVKEIARMMTGFDESETALQHARELLESAEQV
ncbi:MAG: DNA repair protein RecN [Micrococcaceae bacterium]